jgi:hypothetical protein
MGFDQAASDRLLTELGQQIVADRRYAAEDWQGISVVVQVAPRQRLFGYVYRPDGTWSAGMPDMNATLDKAVALSEAMRADGKEPWKACLIQIVRPGPKLKVDFEYDDPARWIVTPGNLKQKVEELRPR